MIRKLALTILLSLICTSIHSQERTREYNNIATLELFGNGYSPISFNYERVLYSHDKNLKNSTLRISGRIGYGTDSRITDSIRSHNIPIEAILLYGRKNNIETSIGITPCIGKAATDTERNPPVHFNAWENVLYFKLGYRYWSEEGLIIRAAPLIQLPSQLNYKPEFTIGLAIGYNF